VRRLLVTLACCAGLAACGNNTNSPRLTVSGSSGPQTPSASGAQQTVTLVPAGTPGDAALQGAVAVLRRRLDAAGIDDATVEVRDGRIVVRLSTTDAARLPKLAAPGRLELRHVREGLPTSPTPCPTGVITVDATHPIDACGTDGEHFRLDPAELTSEDIAGATAQLEPATNDYVVRVTFTAEGGRAFETMSGKYVNQQIAIVVDGVVYSAPRINEQITGGEAQIAGPEINEKTASELAAIISSGEVGITFSSTSG
jgi:preprotein translocase subunit SecD